jgi:multiple sugar transport system ATP-binding protein
MNFFSGQLVEESGRLWFDEGGGKLPVPEATRAELSPRVGQTIVLGVRPEAMSDKKHARFKTEDNQLSMQVTLVQPLGHKMDVYLATDRHPRAVAQIDSYAELRRGETLPVFFDMSRAHFFESAETGKNLLSPT